MKSACVGVLSIIEHNRDLCMFVCSHTGYVTLIV